MIFNNVDEVIEKIKSLQKAPKWVEVARDHAKTNRALVYGDNFDEVLITKIEKIEGEDRAAARKKYSKDIRDMFHRVFEPRSNVFSASGGSVTKEFNSDVTLERLIEKLDEFKGNLSIHKYLSEYFFGMLDVDPNGLLMIEYIGSEKIYPCYKSIDDIRDYESDGQNVKYVVFEPYQEQKGNMTTKYWRVVDDVMDYTIAQNGQSFTFVAERSFSHPFGQVPSVILSNIQKLGTELRFSPLFPIIELSKDYARDKSVLTLYKFLQGFPIHWRYSQQCNSCRGTGRTGEGGVCKHCNGKGFIGKNDVTDVLNVPMPRQDAPVLAPNIAGFVSPDLDTWGSYNDEMQMFEVKIEDTIWGTHREKQEGNETATGRFIDVQPVMNKLNSFADLVEWVHNQLIKWVLRWIENNPETANKFHVSYGRGFIIESPDALLDRYEKVKNEGGSFTVLDKLLYEYILSKYRNNPDLLEKMTKKSLVEPYIHMNIIDVKNVFGNPEAQRKNLFGDFWEQADKNRTVEQLKEDFAQYTQGKIDLEQTTIQPIPNE